MINRIHDPREIQYHLDNSRGIRTIAYVGVKGGSRGPKGTAVNNKGFTRNVPLIRVADIPLGWNAVGASWGSGSCMAQFERMNVLQMFALFEREDVREALAGAGHSTYPVAPVVTAVIDGVPKTFMSEEEIAPFIQRMTKANQKTGPWNGEFRLGRFQGITPTERELKNLQGREVYDPKYPAELPQGKKLAAFMVSQTPFEARVVTRDGEVIHKETAAPVGGYYELLINVELDNILPQADLVVTSGNQTTILHITRK